MVVARSPRGSEVAMNHIGVKVDPSSILPQVVAGAGPEQGDSIPTRLEPSLALQRIGEHAPRYRPRGLIGSGGMGHVFEAYDDELGRTVALKIVSFEDEGRALIREAEAMARVSHPNVVAIHDVRVWTDGGLISMEIVRGSTLRGWLRARRRAPREVYSKLRAAGVGLGAVHRRGLVHLDFKPGNVLVGVDGRVLLTDFGLAREPCSKTEIAGASEVRGTLRFMSPEQHRGLALDSRSDQYSFCAALWGALAGRPAFDAEDVGGAVVAKLDVHLTELPRSVPACVRAVLRRGLAPRPDHRFESMQILLKYLDTAWELPTRSDDAPCRSRAWAKTRPSRSRPSALIGAALSDLSVPGLCGR